MQVLQELPLELPAKSTVLAIGVFDGIHLGHQHLISELVSISTEQSKLSCVLTFINNPKTVIIPNDTVKYISSPSERLVLLRNTGVDLVMPITFDLALSKLRAEQFIELLQDRLRMSGLVIGPNFAMGHHRDGTPETLLRIGINKGFSVTVVDPVSENGQNVSSTVIREAISSGDMLTARKFLGRYFSIGGGVSAGHSRGTAMGFPTANLDVDQNQIIPLDGIYATWAYVHGQRFMSATNVGIRPTFTEQDRRIETFILDFDGDLYGSNVTLEFVARMRDEEKFDSIEDLVNQMNKDVELARTILKN